MTFHSRSATLRLELCRIFRNYVEILQFVCHAPAVDEDDEQVPLSGFEVLRGLSELDVRGTSADDWGRHSSGSFEPKGNYYCSPGLPSPFSNPWKLPALFSVALTFFGMPLNPLDYLGIRKGHRHTFLESARIFPQNRKAHTHLQLQVAASAEPVITGDPALLSRFPKEHLAPSHLFPTERGTLEIPSDP